MIKESIVKIVERIDLEEDEMAEVVEQMMEGVVTEGQIGAFLL
jgi:anthranilate phosphoribosyltransferase